MIYEEWLLDLQLPISFCLLSHSLQQTTINKTIRADNKLKLKQCYTHACTPWQPVMQQNFTNTLYTETQLKSHQLFQMEWVS